MRVISGTVGGLQLKAPKSPLLRPIQDKVKGALFSMLGDKIFDIKILDLFSGVGSLGIEALSRGAKSITFVERDRQIAHFLKQNLIHTKFQEQAQIVQQDVFTFLKSSPTPYSIIFATPPYRKDTKNPDEAEQFHQNLFDAVAPWLAPEGWFILEYFTALSPKKLVPFEILRQKNYGETGLLILQLCI
ncbi:MAG: 16S rRNA (guanine(966)-N(2))-methyltransferase RsmD [Verrucomicrobiae bacterium]|nr:16S rRNA (guanine(966)-N(2))-methyltransferase RsmD [Verrucomicrobiae bacterium]